MKTIASIALAGALALGGCMTAPGPAGVCVAEPGQAFVGRKADAETGLEIRRATRAEVIRWAPPRTAMTMDFREGRVTVAYDDAMVITRVSCG